MISTTSTVMPITQYKIFLPRDIGSFCAGPSSFVLFGFVVDWDGRQSCRGTLAGGCAQSIGGVPSGALSNCVA